MTKKLEELTPFDLNNLPDMTEDQKKQLLTDFVSNTCTLAAIHMGLLKIENHIEGGATINVQGKDFQYRLRIDKVPV